MGWGGGIVAVCVRVCGCFCFVVLNDGYFVGYCILLVLLSWERFMGGSRSMTY